MKIQYAGVVKLADTLDLGSNAVRCAGSSPVTRTNSNWLECVKTTYSSHFLYFDISDERTFFQKNANFFAKVPTENANWVFEYLEKSDLQQYKKSGVCFVQAPHVVEANY